MSDTTTVEIKIDTWRELNLQKNPGDSFDDVIRRLLADGSADGQERAETVSVPERGVSPGTDQQSRTSTPTRIESADVRAAIGDVVESWDGREERLSARRAAAEACVVAAIERGSLSKTEALEDIRPDYPVENQNEDTWWRQNVRPVLRAVGQYDNSAHGYVVELGD